MQNYKKVDRLLPVALFFMFTIGKILLDRPKTHRQQGLKPYYPARKTKYMVYVFKPKAPVSGMKAAVVGTEGSV